MLRQLILSCIIIFFLCLTGIPQVPDDIGKGQELIIRLFSDAAAKSIDTEKEKVHDSIESVLYSILQIPESFDFPFSDVRNLGKIYSDDRKLRFYTWNLLYANGNSRYYGFLQYKTNDNSIPELYRLTDGSSEISEPETAVVSLENWYGCLVYEIIGYRYDKQDYYLLFGYDPYDRLISRRLIDILHFDESGSPVFGKPVFQYGDKLQARVLFEYSARVQMNLHWVPGMKMIVFDHLSPERPSYKGNYQFYGPDFTYDGFRLSHGIWELQENIDVRNAEE